MINKLILAFVPAVFLANIAVSGELGVKLGGRLDVMYSGVNQTLESYNTKRALVTDGKVSIHVDYQTESEMKYGAVLYLNADPSTSSTGESGIVDKNMIYLQSDKFGRIEAGNYPSAAAALNWDTYNFAKATYGVYGYYMSWPNKEANSPWGMGPDMAVHSYLQNPSLPSSYSHTHYSDAPKITYYTKPVENMTIGLTYIPDMDSAGTINTAAGDTSGPRDQDRKNYRPTFKNIINAAIQYTFRIKEDIKLKTTISGEIGQAKKYSNTDLNRNLRAYEVSFGLSRDQYSFGGSYGNWCKTGTYRTPTPGSVQGASYWTMVAAAQYERLGYSISYANTMRAGGFEMVSSMVQKNYLLSQPYVSSSSSNRAYNRMEALSLGADYKLSQGLLIYTELTRFIFKDRTFNKSNNGYVSLSGLRINF